MRPPKDNQRAETPGQSRGSKAMKVEGDRPCGGIKTSVRRKLSLSNVSGASPPTSCHQRLQTSSIRAGANGECCKQEGPSCGDVSLGKPRCESVHVIYMLLLLPKAGRVSTRNLLPKASCCYLSDPLLANLRVHWTFRQSGTQCTEHHR